MPVEEGPFGTGGECCLQLRKVRDRNMKGWPCDTADKSVLANLLLDMSAIYMDLRSRCLYTAIGMCRVGETSVESWRPLLLGKR